MPVLGLTGKVRLRKRRGPYVTAAFGSPLRRTRPDRWMPIPAGEPSHISVGSGVRPRRHPDPRLAQLRFKTTPTPSTAHHESLPDDPGRYTLRLAAKHEDPSVTLGSQIDAEWTFTSARPTADDCPAAPLLAVRVDGDFDLDNSAAGDRPLPLKLGVERCDGGVSQVESITL